MAVDIFGIALDIWISFRGQGDGAPHRLEPRTTVVAMFASFFGLCITQAQCRNISNWGIGHKKRAFEGWVAEIMWYNIRKICGDYTCVSFISLKTGLASGGITPR